MTGTFHWICLFGFVIIIFFFFFLFLFYFESTRISLGSLSLQDRKMGLYDVVERGI